MLIELGTSFINGISPVMATWCGGTPNYPICEIWGRCVGDKHYWLGATDLNREGQWYWTASLSDVGEFVWLIGEPGIDFDLNCMYLNFGNFKVYDNHCTATNMYPVCQKHI